MRSAVFLLAWYLIPSWLPQPSLTQPVACQFPLNRSLLSPGVETDSKDNDAKPIRVPFRLTAFNNLSVPAVVNNNYAVNLMFHSAASEIALIESVVADLKELKLNVEADVHSWGGQSKTSFGKEIPLQIGALPPEKVTIFKSRHSGHQTDGKFGLRHFNNKYIEIDFEASEFVLHGQLPAKVKNWTQIEYEIENESLFFRGTLQIGQNHTSHRFMLHSGFSGFAMFDDAFVENHPKLRDLEVLEENELTDSAGKKLKTRTASLPKFCVGGHTFFQAPVSFFDGAIGRRKYSLVGGDFLKRFEWVFDLNQQKLYLKPSRFRDSAFFTKPSRD